VFEPRGGWFAAAIAAGSGGFWLAEASSLGLIGAGVSGIVGVVYLAAGVSFLLWPGDRRITEVGAFAGVVGALLALPLAFGVGPIAGSLLALSALAAAWASGRMALLLEPHHSGVPAPRESASLAAKVALDDVVLGLELAHGRGFGRAEDLERVIGEVDACRALFAGRGYLDRPETYHRLPPELRDPELRKLRVAGHAIEVLRFESGYAPEEGEPGRERWLGYAPCRTAYAYVLRRSGAGRPWMVCTNGYRMGHAAIDVRLFARFFVQLGLNVVIPVLPLHGPRRRGLHSGSGFLGLDVIDTLHAEAQAIWDMRRLLSWIRLQEPRAIGAHGLSLGGYTTALFSSVVDDLVCSIPGIPLADIPRMLVRHAVPQDLAYAIHRGYSLERAREVLRPVSPLVLAPRVPKAGRMLFGAVADRLVPTDQVRDLWRHWDEPEIVWYQGGHVTFRGERSVQAGIDRTLRAAGLIGADPFGDPFAARVEAVSAPAAAGVGLASGPGAAMSAIPGARPAAGGPIPASEVRDA
jgi:hypothetical protein